MVSGPAAAVDAVVEPLRGDGRPHAAAERVPRLPLAAARPDARRASSAAAGAVALRRPALRLISNVTGDAAGRRARRRRPTGGATPARRCASSDGVEQLVAARLRRVRRDRPPPDAARHGPGRRARRAPACGCRRCARAATTPQQLAESVARLYAARRHHRLGRRRTDRRRGAPSTLPDLPVRARAPLDRPRPGGHPAPPAGRRPPAARPPAALGPAPGPVRAGAVDGQRRLPARPPRLRHGDPARHRVRRAGAGRRPPSCSRPAGAATTWRSSRPLVVDDEATHGADHPRRPTPAGRRSRS